MPPSSGNTSRKDPLEPVLRDVEAELRNRLREACEAEATGVSTEIATEIRRLEDSLLAAAVAAEQTIALRRRMEQRSEGGSPEPQASATPNENREPAPRVREFRDAEGQLWRAWPVKPGQARSGKAAERYLGEYHKGWICFEALESSGRRRLLGQPPGWTELKETELCQLLQQAINAPQRKLRSGTTDRPSVTPPIDVQ